MTKELKVAERAAIKHTKKPKVNSYGEPVDSVPDLTEIRPAVAGSIL